MRKICGVCLGLLVGNGARAVTRRAAARQPLFLALQHEHEEVVAAFKPDDLGQFGLGGQKALQRAQHVGYRRY